MNKFIELFSEFESKPIKRNALKITEEHGILYLEEKSEAVVRTPLGDLTFKCYEEPKIGDYVCYLNAEDVYHCNAEVFADRNIV